MCVVALVGKVSTDTGVCPLSTTLKTSQASHLWIQTILILIVSMISTASNPKLDAHVHRIEYDLTQTELKGA